MFSHAVFGRAFGNRWRTRAHIQPNDLKSGSRNRLKKKVLGNKSKGAKARTRHATGNRTTVQAHGKTNQKNNWVPCKAHEISSPSNPKRNSWVLVSRGMNRYMDEAPIPESEFYHTSSELITERAVEEKEPCSAPLEQSGNEETRAKEAHIVKKQYTKSTSPLRERKWESIPAYEGPHGPLETAISKFVMKIPTKRNQVMILQYPEKYITAVFESATKMRKIG